jgi:hypothetical protein
MTNFFIDHLRLNINLELKQDNDIIMDKPIIWQLWFD